MNLKIFNQDNSRTLSFAAALLLHAVIAGFAFMPSSATLVSAQTIQVSFVAISGAQKFSDNFSQQKKSANLLQKDATQKFSSQKSENKSEAKSASKQETSGIESPNATATKSAQSEPVFNAAYLNNPAPSYPTGAKRKGVEGKVLISVLVKTDGTAAIAKVQKSSGSNDLDEAALEAVKDWKFIPARRSGQIVEASVIVPVEFRII